MACLFRGAVEEPRKVAAGPMRGEVDSETRYLLYFFDVRNGMSLFGAMVLVVGGLGGRSLSWKAHRQLSILRKLVPRTLLLKNANID